ncbi:hypothetical protein ND926_00245 [Vibrio diabolicus]|uniref:hypothetical protein n=1 Tax=Vibrio diabolicus TaxID=50719 RepID=UPI00215EA4EB|nr:hypothetical protein [Vibrio diabolicus]MCR9566069.1 hypothetical protein [Vibrio alginolyticus]MCS0335907.1 hypothetical protein [Vibrio diabolicus]
MSKKIKLAISLSLVSLVGCTSPSSVKRNNNYNTVSKPYMSAQQVQQNMLYLAGIRKCKEANLMPANIADKGIGYINKNMSNHEYSWETRTTAYQEYNKRDTPSAEICSNTETEIVSLMNQELQREQQIRAYNQQYQQQQINSAIQQLNQVGQQMQQSTRMTSCYTNFGMTQCF